jgi:hypothetical protein
MPNFAVEITRVCRNMEMFEVVPMERRSLEADVVFVLVYIFFAEIDTTSSQKLDGKAFSSSRPYLVFFFIFSFSYYGLFFSRPPKEN